MRADMPIDVVICPDGPFLMRGVHRVIDAEGNEHLSARPVVAVCRCGKSGLQPWCDGTHKSLKSGTRRRKSEPGSSQANPATEVE